MRNTRITIQYDGTHYHGWQMQANARTVQGELTRVLSLLDRRHVTVTGAGRTDAGVHAEGQVASFEMERDFEAVQLRDAINGNLDRDLRVTDVQFVEDSFNARFSAKRKTYRYHIWAGPVMPPFIHRYAWHHRGPLDLESVREAAGHLTGRHDFSAFTVADSDFEDHVRTLERLEIVQEGSNVFIFAASQGFLRYMVRTIVGTLLEVGRGRISPHSISGILQAKDRSKAGPTALAAGLTLMRVDY